MNALKTLNELFSLKFEISIEDVFERFPDKCKPITICNGIFDKDIDLDSKLGRLLRGKSLLKKNFFFKIAPINSETVEFNGIIQTINKYPESFSDMSVQYLWHLKKWGDFHLLEKMYLRYGSANVDTCLFEFTTASNHDGILAVSYGKKGYQLYVSFDDTGALNSFLDHHKLKWREF